ncbi:MAG: protein translocase subunit SecD [Planctomycetaceae bacterium]
MMNVPGLALSLLAEAAAAPATQEPAVTSSQGSAAFGWVAMLVFAAIVFLPFVLGGVIERALKLKDIAFRVGIAIFALTLGVAPFVGNYFETMDTPEGPSLIRGAIPLGIDLDGGTNLVYRVDQDAINRLGKRIESDTMDKMRDKIQLRVNPSGTEEVTVRVVGDDRIEVIVPGADEERTEQIKNAIVNLGSLEFSLVVNERDFPNLYQKGLEQFSDPDQKEVIEGGQVRARWVPVAFDAAGVPKLEGVSNIELRRPATVLGKPGFEVLCVVEPDELKRITGDYLVDAHEEFQGGEQVVSFTFNQAGGYLFQNLTFKYQPREGEEHRTKLAILLSDYIHSAPTINDVISTTGQISGRFTAAEIRELTSVLNSGALDVPLTSKPVSEFTVSPLLGLDVREKGTTSSFIAGAAVFLFMLLYYWKAGVVADICLVLNIILVLGIMSLIDATFTLPGLAGLVLTIGMAVDANVLIFERIREEQNKGASLRMAINNGFSKALSTIVDSNLTTLITAVVLYVIGTDQVKGFAVTLFIGIVCSVFTSVYVGRLIFDILERKRWVTSLPMASVISAPNYNFLSKTSLCAMLSVAMILIGLGGVFSRGSDNFDIDFSGGSMVTFDFESPKPDIEFVRKHLEEKFGSDITVEQLEMAGADATAESLIRLRTTNQNEDEVSKLITDAFAESEFKLVRQHVESGAVAGIPPLPEGETAADPSTDYSGGQSATITLSREMLPSTVKESLVGAFQVIDRARFEGVGSLLGVTGEQSGSSAKATVFTVKAKSGVSAADFEAALANFKTNLEADPHFIEKNTFNSSVGREMQVTAIAAMVISMTAIVFYLWFRFQGVNFGLAAIVALGHDVLNGIGLVALTSVLSGSSIGSLLGFTDLKINLPMVAAFLTIVGYSLNDTIVVFDRIREVRGKNPRLTSDMVNASVNQTLSRTLLTSFTTLIVVIILYVLGGEGIHGFAFCLLTGIIVGTYSSIYVASPVLLWLTNREQAKPATT